MTFFTFAKVKTLCGEQDLKIGFSKIWTMINMLMSTLSMILICYLMSRSNSSAYVYWEDFLLLSLPTFVIGAILTTVFVFFDKFCCFCCENLKGEEQIMLYDPNKPESFLVWKDGEVLDYDKYMKQESLESNFSSMDQNYKRQNTSESDVSSLGRQDTVVSTLDSPVFSDVYPEFDK